MLGILMPGVAAASPEEYDGDPSATNLKDLAAKIRRNVSAA